MIVLAIPALKNLHQAGSGPIHSIARSITALQFPQEDRPYTPLSDARWDGCEPVPVLINAPEELHGTIALALRTLSDAAGREFRIVGESDRIPTTLWPRDGQRAAPKDTHPAVIIAVADHSATDMLRSHYRASTITNPKNGKYVTGAVVIAESALKAWPADSPHMLNLILHELGHLAGLGHAKEGTLMHAHVHELGPDGYTEHDLEGISAMFNCA